MEELLRRQWDVLVAWLREAGAEDAADRPSGLGGWEVGDLVAHLGYGIAMIAEIEPAPEGTTPISVGRYVGGYEAASDVIELQSRQLRRQLEPDLVAGIDELAAAAWASLAVQDAEVVVGRRGPLALRDYLLTRLVELVVHADDLERALAPDLPSPLLPDALQQVAYALGAVHFEIRGVHPDSTDQRAWIRRATGRTSDPLGDPPLLS